ncbi:unnamed protein product [Gongylonema pulchrum]|uniref:MFS domain-containing protein n=1 Tax=Gongylonema pulchrum TaxID=637853 RepID=A0A3P7MTG5_9BILA|nr:unnamed protein product [Gongylonema pulchrum]
MSDSTSSSSSSTQEPISPDGGYGWIIVCASFLIHFICDGISFSYGIMFPEIQQYFKATKTMSGIVGSIFLAIPLLSGPLAGALTDIYDCRYDSFFQYFTCNSTVLQNFKNEIRDKFFFWILKFSFFF